jgi:hypothetical protein
LRQSLFAKSPLTASPASSIRVSQTLLLFCGAWDGANHHHEVGEPVLGPPAQPADTPVAESGAQRDRCFQAQEFGLEAHARDTDMAPAVGRSQGRRASPRFLRYFSRRNSISVATPSASAAATSMIRSVHPKPALVTTPGRLWRRLESQCSSACDPALDGPYVRPMVQPPSQARQSPNWEAVLSAASPRAGTPCRFKPAGC